MCTANPPSSRNPPLSLEGSCGVVGPRSFKRSCRVMLRVSAAVFYRFLVRRVLTGSSVRQVNEGEDGHSQQYGYHDQLPDRLEHRIFLSRNSLLSDLDAPAPRTGAVLLQRKQQNQCQETGEHAAPMKGPVPVGESATGKRGCERDSGKETTRFQEIGC